MKERKSDYLKLLSFSSTEEAYAGVKDLASNLNDKEHQIRSCIFDLHAAVEVELQRVFYHTFKAQLFLTDDEKKNEETLAKFDRMVRRLGFMDMYRVLEPILNSWPHPELQYIREINNARNAAAHGDGPDKVSYKKRNPFKDVDCFAEMYFDVWAITQAMAKYFNWVIEMPKAKLRHYVKKYGEEW